MEHDRHRGKEKKDKKEKADKHRSSKSHKEDSGHRRERDKAEAGKVAHKDGERRDADQADRNGKERQRDKQRSSDTHRDKRHRGASEDPAAEDARRQEAEAAEVDRELEKRRQRAAAWQAQKATNQELIEAEAKAREHAEKGAKWSFEEESDEEEALHPAANGAPAGDADAVVDVKMEDAGIKDDDEDKDEVDPLDAFMAGNDAVAGAELARAEVAEEEEVDPLDAFMAGLEEAPPPRAATPAAQAPEDKVKVKLEPGTAAEVKAEGGGENGVPTPADARRKPPPTRRKRFYDSESSSGEDEEDSEKSDDEEWYKNATTGRLSKSDKLGQVDHSTINYPPFRRDFYIEVPELARMKKEEVAEYRLQLDNIKVRGLHVAKPIKNWFQCGLSSRVLEVIKKSGFERPMPIQAQALPVIMSGRDCIGIAKTGSGKTLAFVLPMLRHIKDQPPLAVGDGPVAMVMAPTRELVSQIGKDVRKFAKAVSLTCTMVYGGSGVANQISELKRGTEIVVCTPGRMIDILVTSGGKITNLRRITYLVMDEADRMFDMGFEPQITRIAQNIRPDRQTVMFSATFPRLVEVLAKKALTNPVEIQVGGRSVVNSSITQFVEIREEDQRFLRLLEILGEWYERGKVLIFVETQDRCDNLFRDLLKVGYACLSLHGAKDQSDRESTINDFKTNVSSILVATSVAARGLDVKELVLVINYDPPNHLEDYVHRVGRTGRAGNTGTAITFISPEEDRFAPDLVRALRESGAPVPKDLTVLAEGHDVKRKAGKVQAHGSGYGGSGFKFDVAEEELRNAARKAQAKEAAKAVGEELSDDEGDGDGFGVEGAVRRAEASSTVTGPELQADATVEMREAARRAKELAEKFTKGAINWKPPESATPQNPNLLLAAQNAANAISIQSGLPAASAAAAVSGAMRAQQLAAKFGMATTEPDGGHFEAELEINDFPQHARWKVTHRDTVAALNELTNAAMTTKGQFYPKGTPLPEGERRLFLLIEGPTEQSVKMAKLEIKRILEEYTEKALRFEGAQGGTGKYNV